MALMFSEVPTATDRLALCLRAQRRIGAAHALLHLRRLAAACLRAAVPNDEARDLAATLLHPLKDLDDALAADRLEPDAMLRATSRLSFVRFQFWRIECLRGAVSG